MVRSPESPPIECALKSHDFPISPKTCHPKSILMPPKKKEEALPRGGRQKKTTTNTKKRPPQTDLQPLRPGVRRSERIREQTSNKALDLPVGSQSVPEPRAHQSRKVCNPSTPQPNRSREGQKSQLYAKLTSWLEEVRLGAAEVFIPDQSEPDDSSMGSRSVITLTSLATFENPSTIVPRKGGPKKVTRDSLRTRGIALDAPRADEWTVEFKRLLVEKPIDIAFEQTETLQKSIRNFLKKAQKAERGENSYDAIEELCNEVNKWKATVRLAVITNQEFNDDLEHCKDPSNEAIFQRTVMMSIIDRSHLKTMFDFNCEGLWSLQGNYPLPSTGGPDDIITGPKPDLAIFFRFGSLVGADLTYQFIPKELKSCMNPDKHTPRCFPFIFIEAKKGFENIEPAVIANMHSASQALFNIYVWMNKANQDDAFFKHVRLFSVSINAEKVIARIHRAVLVDNTDDGPVLEFLYDDLNKTQYRYTRDEVCTLIHNILSDYAELKLLPILKAAVQKVLKDYKQDLKRKRDATTLGRASKKPTLASAQTESHDIAIPPVNLSTSFGMSRFEIHDR
ncbi:hypothetical protein F4782DRAFT_517850 [Xylaria castorea]|nr:hypothetical protein F4782DRAFT_517850 [Xylaria castorea]